MSLEQIWNSPPFDHAPTLEHDGVQAVTRQALWALAALDAAGTDVHGGKEPLSSISESVSRLTQALNLILDLDELQTPTMACLVLSIMRDAGLYAATVVAVGACSRCDPPVWLDQQHLDYYLLEAIARQVADWWADVCDQVAPTYVGLRGSLEEGFRVSRHYLARANERVQRALGVDLILYGVLRVKVVYQEDEIIHLDSYEVDRLGLREPYGPGLVDFYDTAEDVDDEDEDSGDADDADDEEEEMNGGDNDD